MRRVLQPADTVYRCGRKTVLKRPDEVVIAEAGPWVLVAVTGWSKNEWVSLKLIRQMKAPKNVWYLGWQGTRMSRNRDMQNLQERHPEIAVWVAETMASQSEGYTPSSQVA